MQTLQCRRDMCRGPSAYSWPMQCLSHRVPEARRHQEMSVAPNSCMHTVQQLPESDIRGSASWDKSSTKGGCDFRCRSFNGKQGGYSVQSFQTPQSVSYTHLRAHE